MSTYATTGQSPNDTAESDVTETEQCPHCSEQIDDTTVSKHLARGLCPATGTGPTDHSEVVREIVDKHGRARMATLYDAYSERVDDPRTRRTVRNYLQHWIQRGAILPVGERRGRRYVSVEREGCA